MKQTTILVATILLMSMGALRAADTRPNIVFLFADDQRADTIGAHGNPYIQTPNLDQIAASGFSFQRNYCAGSFSGAVCVASRAMLMTGRHWMRIPSTKVASDWMDLPLLPSLLESEGDYRSFIVGKWHNGQATLRRAFSSGQALYLGGMANHASFEVQDLVDGELGPRRDAGGFSSSVFATAAVDFIQDAESDRPFFLYVAFMAPHDPIMEGQASSVRESVFLPFQDNQRAVNDGRWKLHIYPKINHRMLFDLKSDPHELTNLAEDAARAPEIERMMALIQSWRTRLGDNDPLSVDDPEPMVPVYDNSKRTLDVWQPKWIRDKYFDGRDNPTHGGKRK